MSDFSSAAELSLTVPDREVASVRDKIEGALSDIEVGVEGRLGGGGGGGGSQRMARRSQTMARQRTEDIRDILLILQDIEDSMDSGGVASGGDGGGLASLRVLSSAGGVVGGGTGLGLGAGAVGATTAGVTAAGLAIPGIALAGILSDDSNENPGQLQESPGETNVVTPNAEVSQELERKLETGLGLSLPSWLTPDGKLGVEDPGPVRVDLVEETLSQDEGASDRPGPGGSDPPAELTGGPESVARPALVADTLSERPDDAEGPGGSTPPSDLTGGPDSMREDFVADTLDNNGSSGSEPTQPNVTVDQGDTNVTVEADTEAIAEEVRAEMEAERDRALDDLESEIEQRIDDAVGGNGRGVP